MSLASGVVNNPAIDNLVQSSLESEYEYLILRLEWIPYEEITDIKPTQIDNVYNAIRKYTLGNGTGVESMIILLCLGNSEECTPTLVSEFARIYSLPTHEYNNDYNRFRRYKRWLQLRNGFIDGFTKYKDNYYMVTNRDFYHYYSRYGFCSACGILRCSPVWCICGHKQLSDGWTSNNKQLDKFIKKSQLQTNSPNHAYLEWIPFDCIDDKTYVCGHKSVYSYGLPTVKSIPLEISDETHDLYYAEVNYLLMRHVY